MHTHEMYKIFTYQNEKLIKKTYEEFETLEGFDANGDFFMEYDFNSSTEKCSLTFHLEKIMT